MRFWLWSFSEIRRNINLLPRLKHSMPALPLLHLQLAPPLSILHQSLGQSNFAHSYLTMPASSQISAPTQSSTASSQRLHPIQCRTHRKVPPTPQGWTHNILGRWCDDPSYQHALHSDVEGIGVHAIISDSESESVPWWAAVNDSTISELPTEDQGDVAAGHCDGARTGLLVLFLATLVEHLVRQKAVFNTCRQLRDL